MTEMFDTHQLLANINDCVKVTATLILMASEIFELCTA